MTSHTLSLFAGPLLDRYALADPAHRPAVEQEIWASYGRELTVLVLDMDGFSLLTQRHGIVHYLAMVRRMQCAVAPVVTAHGGTVVKFEADNCFAVFDQSQAAVQAAREIHRRLASDPHPDAVHVSIGIDFGKVLLVDGCDVFGNAVNRAAKLGEDVAQAGETLVTQEAFAGIPAAAGIAGRPLRVTVSGIDMAVVAL